MAGPRKVGPGKVGPRKVGPQKLGQSLIAGLALVRGGVLRRAGLLRDAPPSTAHRPPLRLFLAEFTYPIKLALRPFRRRLEIAPVANPKTVILMPGFGTSPMRMRYLARQLERAGHRVKRWGLGYNFGPTPENFVQLARRICEVRERYGQPVVLVGWSLGGVFAREMAKLHPDCVTKVITMGSPFSHTPYSNNVWRAYQMVTGHSVANPPVDADLATKPPVETVAFWSPRDGIVSPRAARGLRGERDRELALRCSHMDFADSHHVIKEILRELV